MRWIIMLLAGMVGLLVGDYAAAAIARLPDEGTLPQPWPPGGCTHCGTHPHGMAAIPVIGGLRRSVCHDCGCRPAIWHPGAVLVTAAGFAAMALRLGASPVLPAYCYLVAVAVPLSFVDARCKRLPDALTLPSYPISIALLAIATPFIPAGPVRLLHAALGAITTGSFYLLLATLRPADIGRGDVKLSGILGIYLGWLGLRAFLAGILGAFMLAGVAGLVVLTTHRVDRKSQLAFGPFMITVAMIVILASPVGS